VKKQEGSLPKNSRDEEIGQIGFQRRPNHQIGAVGCSQRKIFLSEVGVPVTGPDTNPIWKISAQYMAQKSAGQVVEML
jgi:hypothetical protein